MNHHALLTSRQCYEKLIPLLEERTGDKFTLITDRSEFTHRALAELNPQFVFIPHWSWIIPEDIHNNFDCVIFHMTDVPFGRGGSPLQNLLSRRIYKTKMSALKCEAGVDTGPVYLKKDFDLSEGSASEIFERAVPLIGEMIVEILQKKLSPQKQTGAPTGFKRRTPSEGNISDLKEIEDVFNYIRMLDAPGYPKAFLETEHLRFEFESASQGAGVVKTEVRISKKADV